MISNDHLYNNAYEFLLGWIGDNVFAPAVDCHGVATKMACVLSNQCWDEAFAIGYSAQEFINAVEGLTGERDGLPTFLTHALLNEGVRTIH